MKNTSAAASLLVLGLLVLGTLAYDVPVTATPVTTTTSTECSGQANPFTVTGATWGTTSSPASPYPGDISAPLTLSLLFAGPCTSPQTTFQLQLQSNRGSVPFAGPNGQTVVSVISLDTTPNSVLTETFDLAVDQNAATGIIYSIPLAINYENNNASSPISEFTTVSIALDGSVSIAYGASPTHLVAGEENNVTVSIANSGSATSGPVSTTVTPTAGVTVFNQLQTTSSIDAGSSVTETLQVYVPTSMAGNAFVLTFSGKYLDAYLNSQTTTQTIGFTVPSVSNVQGSSSFVVTGANWGTGTSVISPLPGTQDQPLVVTLQYLGATPLANVGGTLQLPAGVSDLNGRTSASAFSSAATNQYGTVTLTFNLDLASTVKPGDLNLTLNLTWMTSQSLGLAETMVVTPPPIATLQSSFVVEGSAWQKAASSNSTATIATFPVPGSTDVPLVISLQYLGTASVTDLKGTLSLPTGITDLNGHATATAYTATATPNQVVTLTFNLDVDSSVAPGSYSFGLGLSWTANSVGFSQSGNLSPPPVAAPTSTTVFQLAVSQSNSTVTVGQQTSTGFKLTNEGSSTISSPTFSLIVSSPLVLASVGSTIPASVLAPGASATFSAHLTSGPSATPGIYTGTLTVSFTDSGGVSHTQSFPVNFTLEGTVVLILQDTTVSQSLSGFTVTGSLLNEGSAAAYYSSISGLFGTNTATSVYLGEIDPNTPLPFSITIPYSAPITLSTTPSNSTIGNTSATSVTVSRTRTFSGFSGAQNFTRIFQNGTVPGGFLGIGNRTSGNGTSSTGGSARITLMLSYKDTFGNVQAQPFGVTTSVKTASQLSGGGITNIPKTTSSGNYLADVAYGVVAVVLVILVVGAFLVRRHRNRESANLSAEGRGDQSVI